jgi:predicted phage tail protein
MASVLVSWPENPVSELVHEYQVYEGVNGGELILRGTTTDNQLEILDLPVAQYRWAVRAVNMAGIGPLSEETNGPGLPSAPGAPEVTVLEEL